MENMKKLNDLVTWKIGDYALQLSVVILGVLITFGGGNMLNKRAKAKEITNAMELIKIELETNRKSIQEIGKTLAIEQKASRYALRFENNLSKASNDSLEIYLSYPFLINNFRAKTDALEMFKMSSLAPQVHDKKLILQIIKTYNEIIIVEDIVKWYYDLKTQYMNDMKTERDFLYKEDKLLREGIKKNIQQIWQFRLTSFPVHNVLTFISGARDFKKGFPEVETLLNETIQMIEERQGPRGN